MLDVLLTARRRPMFGASAALHVALGLALVVPPLFATPEPPEPDGFVHIEFVPRLASDAPAVEKVVFLRKGNGGGAPAPTVHSSLSQPGKRIPLTQPKGVTEVLPAPTGEESSSPFEETGERTWRESSR